jgi:PAS domain S-box-containing protein
MSRSGCPDGIDNTVISIVQQGAIKPTVLVRLVVRCALVVLLCDATLAMARDGAGRLHNRPNDVAAVRQTHVDPRTITLPVVDGKGIRFTRLSKDEGLSQTRVIQIVQDDQGFMWFGSQYGLNRYDGYKFKVFKHEPGRTNSLSGVFISSLFKDRSGSLWIGCDEFLDKFDPVTEIFTHYHIDTAGAHGETVPVTHISQDHTGMLWLSTLRGMFRFDPSTGKTTRYRYEPNNPFSLSSDDVKQTGEDRSGTFWVVTSEGLDAFNRETNKVTLHIPLREHSEMSFYEDRSGVFWIVHVTGCGLEVFDRKTNTLTHYSFHEAHIPDTLPTGVMAMLEDRDGTLWFATLGDGLLKFDRKGRRFIRYRHDPANPDSLGQDDVAALFQDREGNIWAGLHMMAPTRFATRPPLFEKFKNEPGNPNSMSGTMVNSIYEDRQGILWIGSIDALNRFDRSTGQYTFYRNFGSGTRPRPTSIIEDRSSFLWVGTGGAGLIRYDSKAGLFKRFRYVPNDQYSLSNDNVTQLLIDHAGRLWAATFDGLNRFDPATSQFRVYKFDPQSAAQIDISLQEDPQGAIWIGTHSAGLRRFDPTLERFTTSYKHDANDPTSLSNNRVNSVHFDHSGTMWVGTQEGLDKFDSKTGKFKNYYEQDGLSGSLVSCILGDERGNLWMSTNNGLSVFNPVTQTFKNYSTADGLPGADLSDWGACSKSPSGEMYFGGFDGGVGFYPDKVVDSPYVPPVVLTDFRLFDHPVTVGVDSPLRKSIGYTSALSLSHAQNIFSLEFSALSYFNPATNRYRYKLDGLDRQWHEVGSDQRLVTYTTLPAKRYIFRVQGATSRGAWSEPGLALAIDILPPWWSTWWFRALWVAVFVGVLWGAHEVRIQQVRRQERKLRDVIETIPTIAWTALPDGSVDFVNCHWQEYSGLSTEQTVGSGWKTAAHPEDVKRFADKWHTAMASGEPFENEVRFRRAADAQYRWFLTRAVPLRDARGKILKWYGTSTDIEDREHAKQLQAELAHITRVNTMGELTASLGHELKQPIAATVINANACIRWLKRDKPDLEKAYAATSRIVAEQKRAAAIIDHLRSLYKKSAPKRELVEVNEIVHEMVVLLRGEAHRHAVSMRIDLAVDLPRITADRVQLQQVLMNLMLNAIEAMNETGGVLTVKSQPDGDNHLLISVTDTGVGLPVDKADQIFDAFFTTKTQGSGMGLAISRSIIDSHGGRLWAAANNGRGATFCFTLGTTAKQVKAPAAVT